MAVIPSRVEDDDVAGPGPAHQQDAHEDGHEDHAGAEVGLEVDEQQGDAGEAEGGGQAAARRGRPGGRRR